MRSVFGIVALFAAGSVVISGQQNSNRTAAVPLFSPVATAAAAGQAALRPDEYQRRDVQLNLDALGGTYGAAPAQSRLELTFFSGETHVAVLDYLENSLEGRSWVGHLEGVPLSSVILSVTRGVVAGTVVWPGGHEYRVYPNDRATYSVSQVDGALPPVDDAIVPPPSRSDAAAEFNAGPRAEHADDPSVIDMLVIFDPSVRHEVGSYAGVAAGIDMHVANVNRGLSNSRVPTRLRLVATLEIPVALRENCARTLDSIRVTNDGNLDEVEALRNAYGADLVHVLIFPLPPDCSGIAYRLTSPSAAFGFGLSVLNRSMGSPFAHEVGHNLGGGHDWYVDDLRYSAKGYVDCAAGFVDLTAYSSECNARGMRVSGIPHYSNPSVQYQGRPTGVPRGTGMNCVKDNLNNPPCDADVAFTIQQNMGAHANYRPTRFVATSFPPRNEGLDFRAQLEGKYRDALRRPVAGSYADPEGAVVWTVEYLRYRLGQCSHEVALDKVRRQVRGQGLPEPCGSGQQGAIGFPPRNETYDFRLELEEIYRVDLRRQQSDTRVDPEGDVVWIQEYLRYRLNGCSHPDAVGRTLLQVDGLGVQPVCR
jgi:hypothetical protein